MALEANAKVNYACSYTSWFNGEFTDVMAHGAWVTTSTRWCEKMKAEAELMEHRVYPAEFMPDFPSYRIDARKCSFGTACNLARFPCKWAYFELGDDPFKLTV